jgi:hypothetical protein
MADKEHPKTGIVVVLVLGSLLMFQLACMDATPVPVSPPAQPQGIEQEMRNCVASSASYLLLVDPPTRDTSTSGTKMRCSTMVRVVGGTDHNLLVYTYISRSHSSLDTAGWAPGSIPVPVEAQVVIADITWFQNTEDGSTEYDRLPKIIVLYDDDDCRWLDPLIRADEVPSQYIREIPDPCQ